MTTQLPALTATDRRTLATCEKAIEFGMRHYLEVGGALLTIRNQQLYRETHQTFRDYCTDRWGFSDSRARQLIAAVKVAQDAKTEDGVTRVTPVNERTARELNRVPEEDRRAVFDQAVIEAGTAEKVTAKGIREAAWAVLGKRQEPGEDEAAEPDDATGWSEGEAPEHPAAVEQAEPPEPCFASDLEKLIDRYHKRKTPWCIIASVLENFAERAREQKE